MNFVKAFGLLLVMTSCSLGGAMWGGRYRRRVSALEEAHALLLTLRGQLAFSLFPPADLLHSALRDPAHSRCDYLVDACRRIELGEAVDNAWHQAVSGSGEPFTDQDRIQIFRVGDLLGKNDLETQLSQLALLSERVEQYAGQARGEAKVQSRLCITLGALLGLALTILLV